MERLEYMDYAEFACEIADKFDSLENEFSEISIIAKYYEAKEIIKELLCLGFDIASLDIHDELWENYYDEYIISVSCDEECHSVWCEKFKRETGYINDTPSVAYIMDNCSSNVIKHIDSEKIYEVCVGEEEESRLSDTQNSESIYVSRAKDGTPIGFSKSWSTVNNGVTCYSSYSHYSDNINMLKAIASDFGVDL